MTTIELNDYAERAYRVEAPSGKRYVLFVRKIPTAAQTRHLKHKIWRLKKFCEDMAKHSKGLVRLKNFTIAKNCSMSHDMTLSQFKHYQHQQDMQSLMYSKTCVYLLVSNFSRSLLQHIVEMDDDNRQFELLNLMALYAQILGILHQIAPNYLYDHMDFDDFVLVDTTETTVEVLGHPFPTNGVLVKLLPRDKVLHSSYHLTIAERKKLVEGQRIDFMLSLIFNNPMKANVTRKRAVDTYFVVQNTNKKLSAGKQFRVLEKMFPDTPKNYLLDYVFPMFYPNIYAQELGVEEELPDISFVNREDFIQMIHLCHDFRELVNFIFWRWFKSTEIV